MSPDDERPDFFLDFDRARALSNRGAEPLGRKGRFCAISSSTRATIHLSRRIYIIEQAHAVIVAAIFRHGRRFSHYGELMVVPGCEIVRRRHRQRSFARRVVAHSECASSST